MRNRCLASFQKLRKIQESYGGYVVCISCGKILPLKDAEGGHFIPRRFRATEMERHNVYPQCHECNQHKGGNVEAYRKALVGKVGLKEVQRLESLKHTSFKRTSADYTALKRQFDAEIRKLEKELV